MDSRKMDEWKEPIWSATTVYCVYSHNSSTKRYIDTNILKQKFFWKWELNHLLWLKLKKKLKTKTQMKIKRLNASTPDTFSKFIASRVRAGEAGLHLYIVLYSNTIRIPELLCWMGTGFMSLDCFCICLILLKRVCWRHKQILLWRVCNAQWSFGKFFSWLAYTKLIHID